MVAELDYKLYMNLVIVMSAGAIKLSKVSRGVSVRVGESLD